LFAILLELAAGGLLVLLLVELRGEVSRGFALFAGGLFWLCGALALWMRLAAPALTAAPNLEAPSSFWSGLQPLLLAAFVGSGPPYLVLVGARAGVARAPAGLLAGLGGLAALVASGLAQTGPGLFGLGELLSRTLGALSLGGAMAGMILGHWYLVTPALSTKPLLRISGLLIGTLAAQVVLLPVLLLSAGPAAQPALGGDLLLGFGVFFWLRVLFGLLLPLAMAVMVWQTTKIRSLQSATGLLYLLVSLLFGGEAVARSIFFFTGVPV
jgi:hypothetical protein